MDKELSNHSIVDTNQIYMRVKGKREWAKKKENEKFKKFGQFKVGNLFFVLEKKGEKLQNSLNYSMYIQKWTEDCGTDL